MTLDVFREYCLAKPATTEELPFGPNALVFKVMGKMYALLSLDEVPARVNLKCDPEEAIELRERHEAILPGYHMNKQHWNTVVLDSSLPHTLLTDMIDASYDLVVAKLKKADREKLHRLSS